MHTNASVAVCSHARPCPARRLRASGSVGETSRAPELQHSDVLNKASTPSRQFPLRSTNSPMLQAPQHPKDLAPVSQSPSTAILGLKQSSQVQVSGQPLSTAVKMSVFDAVTANAVQCKVGSSVVRRTIHRTPRERRANRPGNPRTPKTRRPRSPEIQGTQKGTAEQGSSTQWQGTAAQRRGAPAETARQSRANKRQGSPTTKHGKTQGKADRPPITGQDAVVASAGCEAPTAQSGGIRHAASGGSIGSRRPAFREANSNSERISCGIS